MRFCRLTPALAHPRQLARFLPCAPDDGSESLRIIRRSYVSRAVLPRNHGRLGLFFHHGNKR